MCARVRINSAYIFCCASYDPPNHSLFLLLLSFSPERGCRFGINTKMFVEHKINFLYTW